MDIRVALPTNHGDSETNKQVDACWELEIVTLAEHTS